jgi:hypothetical protein
MTCHECGKQWNEYYNHRATHIPEGMNAEDADVLS